MGNGTLILQERLAEEYFPLAKPITFGQTTLFDGRLNKRTFTTDRSEVSKNADGEFVFTLFRGVEIQLFLSDDGGKLIDEIEANKFNIAKSRNLIQLFIETDKDVFSKRVVRAIVGKMDKADVDFEAIFGKLLSLDVKDMERLIGSFQNKSSNFLSVLWDVTVNAIPQAIGKVTLKALEITIGLFEELRLSDKWWQADTKRQDKEKENHVLSDTFKALLAHAEKAIEKIVSFNENLKNSYLRKWKGKLGDVLKSIGDKLNSIASVVIQFKTWLQEIFVKSPIELRSRIALVCGFWNGIIDMITGLLFIVKVMIQASEKANEASQYVKNNLDKLLEEADNFYDSIGNTDWGQVMKAINEKMNSLPSMMSLFLAAFDKVRKAKDKAVQSVKEINEVEWFYYIGYGVTFIIPVGYIANLLGKAGKAGEVLGKLLVWVNDVLEKVFQVATKGLKTASEKLMEILKAVSEKIRAGTKAINELVEKIFAKLKEWLESFVGKIGESKIDDAFKVLFPNDAALIKNLQEIGLSVTFKDDMFELFFEGKRIMIGTEEEMITHCEGFEKGFSSNIKSMLKEAVKNGFEKTEEHIALLRKQKKAIQEILENKRQFANSTEKGNFGEIITSYTFENAILTINGKLGMLKSVTLEKLESIAQKGHNGIDCIFEFSSPPPKYFVVESKFGTSSLTQKITKSGGEQMSQKWVRHDLIKGVVSADVRRKIFAEGYEPILAKVSKSGKITMSSINQTATKATEGNKWVGKLSNIK